MDKKITIDDVAKALNLSKTTVSRAISGKGRIGKETRAKVNEYIEKTGYRPSAIAKGLAQSKTYNIAFVMPGEASASDMPFFQKCMWGISNMASKQDYDVILAMVAGDDISQLERLADNHTIDGAILGRTYEKDPSEIYLKKQKIPFVTIGSSLDPDVIQIDNDHVSACRELTGLLLLKGLRRIGLIGGNMNSIVNQKRLEGYRTAFVGTGNEIDESLIFLESESNIVIENAVEKLVREKADCILCMDDSICTQVITKLMNDNISIPGDIRVASFYNSPLLEHSKPAITSLQFDITELGMKSCAAVIANIEEENIDSSAMLGYQVVMKESTMTS